MLIPMYCVSVVQVDVEIFEKAKLNLKTRSLKLISVGTIRYLSIRLSAWA